MATPPALAILKRAGIEAKMITAGHIGHIVDDRGGHPDPRLLAVVVRDRTEPLGPW